MPELGDRTHRLLAIAVFALLAFTAFGLTAGHYPVAWADVVGALGSLTGWHQRSLDETTRSVIVDIRLPRVFTALVVGAGLAASGALFQHLFRNPLVSPDILGVSSGAALGAVWGIFWSMSLIAIQGLAFAGGLAAVALVLCVGYWVRGHARILALVLTGVVVGSFLAAAIALLKTLAEPSRQLPAITFWLLGSFSAAGPRELGVVTAAFVAGLFPMVALRWRVDVLSLPEDEARALGIPVTRHRIVLIAAATLITASAVAVAGMVGWVGLLIPHAARFLVGSAFRHLLPLSALLGASFMLVVDTLARTISSVEIPPGVITALIGAPLFLWMLASTTGRD
jgi:iron complex transport system permease protein